MSTNNFVCPICGNTDIYSIGYLNGKPYCRRCISFRGEEVERKPSYPKKHLFILNINYPQNKKNYQIC